MTRKVSLVGSASTQSRARRPLPPGAVSARTIWSAGVRERVRFEYGDGHSETRVLLSWPVGQWGGLWGSPVPAVDVLPTDIWHAVQQSAETHGSYGSHAEHDLADALGETVGDLFLTGDLACRFGMNGSDVCAMAVRVARHATGRSAIASSGYHGHSDSLAHPPALGGIPTELSDLHRRFDFGDVNGMRLAAKGAACVFVEVPAWDDEEGITAFLRWCRVECDRQGIPLIIDDVVCGARLALGGSLERYRVKCDIVTLGKAMSAIGGISAIVGDTRLVGLLADEVFYSGTFFGSPGSCSVAAATLRWLSQHRSEVYGSSGHLQTIGRALKDGLNDLGIKCIGQPERSVLVFEEEAERRKFCGRMIAGGVMMDRPQFSSLMHTMGDVEKTLEVARMAIGRNA